MQRHITTPENMPDIDLEFHQYAASKYPQEACAFVIDGKLVPVENISETPEETFRLSTRDTILATKAQGFVHSHPNASSCPSMSDMVSQIATGIPFGICTSSDHGATQIVWFGDHTMDIPLEGRPFVFGVLDCYDTIRSATWQKRGIKLKNYPRWSHFWDDKVDLYVQNYQDAGFEEVDSLEPYDVILMKIGHTEVINHAAIYMGDQMILHHLMGKESRLDLLGRWGKFAEKTVRYNG